MFRVHSLRMRRCLLRWAIFVRFSFAFESGVEVGPLIAHLLFARQMRACSTVMAALVLGHLVVARSLCCPPTLQRRIVEHLLAVLFPGVVGETVCFVETKCPSGAWFSRTRKTRVYGWRSALSGAAKAAAGLAARRHSFVFRVGAPRRRGKPVPAGRAGPWLICTNPSSSPRGRVCCPGSPDG